MSFEIDREAVTAEQLRSGQFQWVQESSTAQWGQGSGWMVALCASVVCLIIFLGVVYHCTRSKLLTDETQAPVVPPEPLASAESSIPEEEEEEEEEEEKPATSDFNWPAVKDPVVLRARHIVTRNRTS
jgi:hypothetical protein